MSASLARPARLPDVFAPGRVMGVQELVAQVTAGAFGEEIGIDPGDGRILVGFANIIGGIFRVDGLGPRRADGRAGWDRLAAAAEAAARACHELNEVALAEASARADVIQHPLGVRRAVADADLQGRALQPGPVFEQPAEQGRNRPDRRNLELRIFHAVKSPHRYHVGMLEDVFDAMARDQLEHTADRGFHDSARGAEYHA